jgi:hypothetical protein
MTAVSVAFTPLVPLAILVGFALLAAAIIGLGLVLRQRGVWLRAAGLILILLALMDPSLVREDRTPLKQVVALVLDRTASQTIGDRSSQTDKAAAELQARLKALGNVDLRVITVEDSSDNGGTQLFTALSAALADVPAEQIAGVFMVTDGVVHDIPASPAALGFKAPIHALITGYEGERDRRIELVEAPRFGIVGKDQTIALRVLDTDDKGEPVTLDVRRDGNPIATIRAAIGETIKVPVRIEHGGSNVVELEVAAIPGELTTLNNKAVVTIDGVRDKLKVLLVSGEPHQGERMWRNILKSDANVDLVHFTILRPPEKQDATPINELSLIAFPTADLFGRKIKDFDLIIFDRYSNQSVLPPVYLENIVRYVRDGGALLLATGPDFAKTEGIFFSPIGRIAPARPDGNLFETGFRAVVTEDGKKHPVTRGLAGADQSPPAWSPWFRQISAELRRGTSVMSGLDDRPILVLSREGNGRVAELLSDQLWLWARGYQGGGPYVDLLRRLAHWLMKEPDLEEEALRAKLEGRTFVVTRQSLKPDVPPAEITTPTGKQIRLPLALGEPGLWSGTTGIKELGLYRVKDGDLTILVNVGPDNPREFQEVVSTTQKLAPLVEATGGTVRRLATGPGNAIAMPRILEMRDSPIYGGSDYAAIRKTGASEVKGIGFSPLAIGFLGLALLLSSLILSWLYEGGRGLKALRGR